MNKQRKTSHILNVFQYDADGHVVLPASLTLSIAPGAGDNNSKVPTTSWVRTYVTGLTYATQSYVLTQITNLIDAAPGALDTLNELAAALGDDPNFATTITNSLATKLALTGGTLTGDLTLSGTNPRLYFTDTDNNPDYFISNTDGTFTVYDVTNSVGRFKIYTTGHAEFTNNVTAVSFIKSGGTSAQFLMADGSVSTNPGWLTGITSSQVTTALGYTPVTNARTITINGTAYDLSADRSWSIASGVTSFNTRTGAITLSSADVTGALGFTPYNNTNPSGYITGITSANVTTALGFTPYNSTNPSGYITSSGTAAAINQTVGAGSEANLVYATIADNDFFRIRVGGASNAGWAEIATADDGTEPIYVRQYTGVFSSVTRTATLLDGSGNTSFPGTVTAPTFSGALSGNASTSSSISGFNNPTTAATANTIVYRDGSGDIYGRYLFGSYQNSSDDVSAGNITYIMAKFGDNYHRSATAAKVQSFLGLGSAAYQNTGAFLSSSGSITVGGYLTVNGAGSSSSIYMSDSDEGNREIHCNSNRIGFLTQAGAWGAWCDDSGNWNAANFSGSSSGTNTGDQTNISGNAGSATNLTGQGVIQRTSSGTSYSTMIQVRETSGASGNTNIIYAPAIGFHWGGVVASSILMEASGRISIRNNPGGSYESFIAATIYADNFSGPGTGLTGTAASLSVGYASRSDGSLKLWATSHPNDYYIVNNWTGSHWYLTTNHGSPVRVGYADSAGSVSSASYANYLSPNYAGGVQSNPQVYFNNGIGLKVAMTGHWSVWSDTVWVNGYTGSDVPWMCAMHFLRNSEPRMAISAQTHGSGSYGGVYEILSTYNAGYAYNMNQYVRTSDSPTFNNINTNGVGNFGPNSGGNQGIGIYYGGEYGRIRFYQSGNDNHSTIHSFSSSWGGGYSAGYINIDGQNGVNFGGWNNYDGYVAKGGTAWFRGDVTAYSDARVKGDVKIIENAVDKINAIKGVTFIRTDKTDNKRYAGVIAQDILAVLPEVVTEDQDGMYSVAYGNLNALLIEAIKEQQTQIENLTNKIDLLTQNK